MDHSPKRALGWDALKQARSSNLSVKSKEESAQPGNLEIAVEQRSRF
jgi:hypothetical protein